MFDFVPTYVVISYQYQHKYPNSAGSTYGWGYVNYYYSGLDIRSLNTEYKGKIGFGYAQKTEFIYAKRSQDSKQIMWYTTNTLIEAEGQYNSSGFTYCWIAIG